MDRGARMKANVEGLLSLCDIGLMRAGQPLVDDLSFTIAPGSIVMLLGPNGAGKSLVLKLCHGLIEPDRGEIRWAHLTAHGFVAQHPIFLRRSALRDILHALSLAKWPRPARSTRAMRALIKFGLKKFTYHPARQLSGGEQQKLAIARAWAMKPDVLLLDEPTASLDLKATKDVEHHIRMLSREGVTIIMSTHDIAQARRLADRILFIKAGRLVEDAPAQKFFKRPLSIDARHFLAGLLD
jgi:tungstate transport system ATP-binding protein